MGLDGAGAEVAEARLDFAVSDVNGQNARVLLEELNETLIGILMREPGFYKRLRGRVKPEWFVNDADRVIWDRMTARFEAGQEVNLSLLGQDLTAEELARLSRLTADRAKLSNTPEECADAAAVMEREYDKRQRETLDLSSLSAEEFRKLFVDPDKRSSS